MWISSFKNAVKVICTIISNSIHRIVEAWKKPLIVLGVIGYTAIVVVVQYTILRYNNRCYCSDKCLQSSETIPRNIENGKCHILDCRINCAGILESESLPDYINAVIQKVNCSSVELTVNHTSFINATVIFGWLSDVAANITSLELNHCNISEIGEYAFKGIPFTYLNSLTIANSKITHLRKTSFLGMKDLSKFSFRCDRFVETLEIEEAALEGMKETLQVLKIEWCLRESQELRNLAGQTAALLETLQILDWSYNKIQTLEEFTFIRVPSVRRIFLNHNAINYIDAKAFWPVHSLESLWLSNNRLETLSKDVVQYMPNDTVLHLGGNRWVCNCSLQWMKDLYIASKQIDKRFPPTCRGLYSFECMEFECSTESSNSYLRDYNRATNETYTTSVSETSSNLRSTDAPSHLKGCEKKFPSPHVVISYIGGSTDNEYTNETGYHIGVSYREVESDPPVIKLRLDGKLREFMLFYFNPRNKTQKMCFSFLHEPLYLRDLSEDSEYIACLVEKESATGFIPPTNCFSFKTLPSWDKRLWIANEDRLYWITGVSSGVVGALLLGCCLSLFFVRLQPTLFEKKRKKFSFKSKRTSNDNVKKISDPDELYSVPDPTYSSVHSGYLTPRNQRQKRYKDSYLETIPEFGYCPHRSYWSESSIYQDEGVYADNIYEASPIPQVKRISKICNLDCHSYDNVDKDKESNCVL